MRGLNVHRAVVSAQPPQHHTTRNESVRKHAWTYITAHRISLLLTHIAHVDDKEVFKCRVLAAQKLAEEACEKLGASPPEPPFTKANLRIHKYVDAMSNYDNATMAETKLWHLQNGISIAVEPGKDIVSNGVRLSLIHI